MKRWLITLGYDGQGKFEYESDQADSHLACAVATKEMFKQLHFLDPKATRITAIQVDFAVNHEGQEQSGDSF
jgi:hypothetical protein